MIKYLHILLLIIMLAIGLKTTSVQANYGTASHPKNYAVGPILYTQNSGAGGTSIRSSQDLLAGNPFSQAADDFTVTGAGWIIDGVKAFGGSGNANSTFNVVIWNNAGSLPGTSVCTYTALPYINTVAEPVIELSATCVLGVGTYWLTIQQNNPNNTTGWQWTNNNSAVGLAAVWQAPGNSLGCVTTWTPLNSGALGCGVVAQNPPDRRFEIYGNPSPTATPTHTPINTATATASNTATHTTTASITVTSSNTPTATLTLAVTSCVLVATSPNLIAPVHRAHTTDTTPTFTWSSVTNSQSYRVMVYLEDRSFEFKKRVFVTSYTLAAAEALTPAKYLWRVRTQDNTCSTWTSWSGRNTLFVD